MDVNPIEPITPMELKPRRRWGRWLLVVLMVVAIGVWCGRFWLGERLADALRVELAARGFHVSWKSAAFQPWQGISFKGFQVHRDADRSASLMSWDHVNIRKGQAGWKSLHLHAAGSELVLGEGADRLQMTDLAMDLDVDEAGLSVEKLRGLTHGLTVEVTGAVSFPKSKGQGGPAPKPQVPAAANAKKGLEGVDLRFLRTVGEWIDARQLGKKAVQLSVNLQDRESGPGVLLKADLDGTDCEWRGQRFSVLGITMEWPLSGKKLEPIMVTRVATSPEKMAQKLAVVVDLEQREVRVDAESAVLELVAVLSAAVPSLADELKGFRTEQAASWQMSGVIPWDGVKSTQLKGQVLMTGSLGISRGSGESIEVSKLQSAFELKGQKLGLTDFRSGLWGGQIRISEAQLDVKSHDWLATGVKMQGMQWSQAGPGLGLKTGLKGKLDGAWRGSGGSTLKSVNVRGSLQCAEASFPVPALDGTKKSAGKTPRIEFKQFQTDFSFRDQTLTLQATTSELWGGRMGIEKASLNLKASTWNASGAQVQEVRISQLRAGLGLEEKPTQGVLQGSWQGGGGMDLTSLSGQGNVRIANEGFNKLPLLGPLSIVFVVIAPGFVEDASSGMVTDYALTKGILSLSKLKVDNTLTTIQASGDLNLVTQTAKLTARARLRGIAGLPTAVLGRLLTLDGDGPFSDVRWRLRYGLGMVQGEGLAGEAEKAGRAGVGVAGEAAKGVGKAVKGIFGIPKKLLNQEKK